MRGLGAVYRRGKVWWIAYYPKAGGPQVRESARSENKRDALTLLKTRMASPGQVTAIAPGVVLLGDLANMVLIDYEIQAKRTLPDVQRRFLLHLLPYFGNAPASQITADHIQEYIRARRKKGAANAQINRELAALKRGYRLAQIARKLDNAPHIPHLYEDNARQGFFEVEDAARVIELLPEYWRLPFTLSYVSGWRLRAEVLRLEWSMVHLPHSIVRLSPALAKNREGRPFILPDELRDSLSRLKDEGRSQRWVFAWKNGQPLRYPYVAWRAACKGAGLDGKIPHDFRRTAVRNLVRSGVPEKVAMDITGHKTRAVFDRYNIVSEKDLREAAAKISQNTRALFESRTITITKSDAGKPPISQDNQPITDAT